MGFMRTLTGVFFGAVVGILLVAGAVMSWRRAFEAVPSSEKSAPFITSAPAGAPTPSVLRSPRPETRSAELFLVARLRDPQAWEEVLLVENGALRPLPLPPSVDRRVFPVTDGRRVYAYVSSARGSKIVAFSLSGREEEIVTDSTPLVEPRGLFASPNGAFLAFFLDERNASNTELWTYDTATRTKRVSVERLTRPELSGPYFASDGSFVLRAGEQLLAGSPRRTGVDILRVPLRNANIRWEAGVARSPDGERLVLVDEVGDERTVVTRVLEYGIATPEPRIRFSLAKGSVRILGWNERDELFLIADTRRFVPRDERFVRPTLWMLAGGQSVSRPLGKDVPSVALAGSESAVGVLRAEGEQVILVLQKAASAQGRTVAVLPPSAGERSPVPSVLPVAPSPSPKPDSSFRLLQMLHVAAVAGVTASQPPVVPAALLTYLTEHVRELTDAPPAEPVALERVWLLAAPNAAYVDYRIGSTLWRRLVEIEERAGTIAGATVLGVYAPVEGEWVLARGRSVSDATPLQLYEYEVDLQQWIEKPVAPGVVP